MSEIWANRLIAGTKTWAQCVKSGRSEAVKEVLRERVVNGKVSVKEYLEITGTEFEVKENG